MSKDSKKNRTQSVWNDKKPQVPSQRPHRKSNYIGRIRPFGEGVELPPLPALPIPHHSSNSQPFQSPLNQPFSPVINQPQQQPPKQSHINIIPINQQSPGTLSSTVQLQPPQPVTAPPRSYTTPSLPVVNRESSSSILQVQPVINQTKSQPVLLEDIIPTSPKPTQLEIVMEDINHIPLSEEPEKPEKPEKPLNKSGTLPQPVTPPHVNNHQPPIINSQTLPQPTTPPHVINHQHSQTLQPVTPPPVINHTLTNPTIITTVPDSSGSKNSLEKSYSQSENLSEKPPRKPRQDSTLFADHPQKKPSSENFNSSNNSLHPLLNMSDVDNDTLDKLNMLATMVEEYQEASASDRSSILYRFKRLLAMIPPQFLTVKFIRSQRKQTLLYFTSRMGCVPLFMELLQIENLPLTGFQYESDHTKSTVLHGANWGGHIEIVALILLRSHPEKNEVIGNNGDIKSWYPQHEMNNKLEEETKKKLKELWNKWKQQGPSAVKKFITTSDAVPGSTTTTKTNAPPKNDTTLPEIPSDELVTNSIKIIRELRIIVLDIWEAIHAKKYRFRNNNVKENGAKASQCISQLQKLTDFKHIDHGYKALLKDICDSAKLLLHECLKSAISKIESKSSHNTVDPKLKQLKERFDSSCSVCANVVPSERAASIDTLTNIIKKLGENFDMDTNPEFILYWNKLPKEKINEKNSSGQTLLYVACRYGCLSLVKIILATKGVRINGHQECTHGSTPLHGANWACSVPIVAMLLASGANPQKNSVSGEKGLFPYEEHNTAKTASDLNYMKSVWEAHKRGENLAPFFPMDWVPNPALCDITIPTDEGITIDCLINLVTSAELIDPKSVFEHFILTYRLILRPVDVFTSLIKRTNDTSEKVIHIRVIQLIDLWIKDYRYDIESDIQTIRSIFNAWLNNTHRFHLLSDDYTEGSESANDSNNISILKETLQLVDNTTDNTGSFIITNNYANTEQYTFLQDPEWRKLQSQLYPEIHKLNTIIVQKYTAPPVFTPSTPPPRSIVPKKREVLSDIDPEEVARQLTLIEEQLFHKITILEYLYWIKDDSKSPNIVSYNFWQNNFKNWIKLEILTRQKTKHREKIIKAIIDIMKHLIEMKNFNGVYCIGTVLTSAPISDLKKCWEHLKKESTIIEQLMNASKIDFHHYEVKTPCVLPFPLFLENLTKMQQTTVVANGRINWLKLRHIGSYLVIIRSYISHKYNYLNQHNVETFIKQRLENSKISSADLDKLVTLAINSDQTGTPGEPDLDLHKIISKFSHPLGH